MNLYTPWVRSIDHVYLSQNNIYTHAWANQVRLCLLFTNKIIWNFALVVVVAWPAYQAYTGDVSPFGLPHKISEEFQLVRYNKIAKDYRPTVVIAKGAWIGDIKQFLAGKCLNPAQKTKAGLSIAIENMSSGRQRMLNPKNCVAIPNVNSFVRRVSDNSWHKLTRFAR